MDWTTHRQVNPPRSAFDREVGALGHTEPNGQVGTG
jgi:hypothetical protein